MNDNAINHIKISKYVRIFIIILLLSTLVVNYVIELFMYLNKEFIFCNFKYDISSYSVHVKLDKYGVCNVSNTNDYIIYVPMEDDNDNYILKYKINDNTIDLKDCEVYATINTNIITSKFFRYEFFDKITELNFYKNGKEIKNINNLIPIKQDMLFDINNKDDIRRIIFKVIYNKICLSTVIVYIFLFIVLLYIICYEYYNYVYLIKKDCEEITLDNICIMKSKLYPKYNTDSFFIVLLLSLLVIFIVLNIVNIDKNYKHMYLGLEPRQNTSVLKYNVLNYEELDSKYKINLSINKSIIVDKNKVKDINSIIGKNIIIDSDVLYMNDMKDVITIKYNYLIYNDTIIDISSDNVLYSFFELENLEKDMISKLYTLSWFDVFLFFYFMFTVVLVFYFRLILYSDKDVLISCNK